MLGKQKCKILKEIRQRIADENDIPFVTRECHFQGECRGTCPRCESELRYLEQQLARRAALGRQAAVAALCAGMAFAAAGCGGSREDPGKPADLTGAVAWTEPEPTVEPRIDVLEGEIAWPEQPEKEAKSGKTPAWELTGMIAPADAETSYG